MWYPVLGFCPEGPSSGSNRVKRGGSWNNNAANTRAANRNRNKPDNRNNNLGFRLALPPAHRETADAGPSDPDEIPSLAEGQREKTKPVLVACAGRPGQGSVIVLCSSGLQARRESAAKATHYTIKSSSDL